MFGDIYRKFSKRLYGTGISKLSIVRCIHSIVLKNIEKPEFVTIFDYKLFLDRHDQDAYSVILDSETKELQLLRNIIKEGDTVIDIGANIGFYTLLFRNIVGKKGRVIAFEPEPKNFSLLRKTIDTNNFENVIAYQMAVGSKNSKVKLLLSEDAGEHQISDNGHIDVDCIRLDDYIKSADFIKLDVEGYEIEILKGMQNLLQKNIILMSEFYVKLLVNNSNPKEFFTILTENGFSFVDMRNRMKPIDESNFMKKYNEKSGATDILCTKILPHRVN